MPNRITGINSGLDVEALVTATLKPHRIKIDTETQKKKVLEYQQEQYKQIMTDVTGLYDKYFDVLKSGNLMSTSSYQTLDFTSSDTSKVTAKGFAGASADNYTVGVTQLASKASTTLTISELTTSLNNGGTPLSLTFGAKTVNFNIEKDATNNLDTNKTVSSLNAALNAAGINVSAKYSQFSDGIILESGSMGTSQNFNVSGLNDAGGNPLAAKVATGTDLVGTITKNGVATPYNLSGTSNTVTVDNIQFTLKAPTSAPVTLSGETNVTNLKDKIVGFVNDYNKILEQINTKIYEARDRDYMPLTDEQKKEMTDDQIASWEKKAKTGLLRKDSDLQRITSSMKSAISTVISGSGMHLEAIGISPVKNYAEKNGMLTVDEGKLTQALQENAANVKDLFIRAASSTDPTDKGGVFTKLKSIIYGEFKSNGSSLAKKVGLTGTSTEFTSTLARSLTEKKQKIAELNTEFTRKESALYKKYSALEKALQSLNSQQSTLSSMLGQG